jgi:hypothetical protein
MQTSRRRNVQFWHGHQNLTLDNGTSGISLLFAWLGCLVRSWLGDDVVMGILLYDCAAGWEFPIQSLP